LEGGRCRERVKESGCGRNIMYSYENGKLRLVETVPGMGEGDKGEG
jgi:hypothetical protein